MQPTCTAIIFDSNVLIADFLAHGVAFRSLLELGRLEGIKLYVPEVVRMEVLREYRQCALVAQGSVTQHARKLGWTKLSAEVPDASEAAGRYERQLDRLLANGNVQLLGMPSIPHAQLAKLAVNRQKPFKDNGSGYRDALIWASVLELAKSRVADHVVLLTADATDFGSKGKDGSIGLADDLCADLSESGVSPQSVSLITSINRCAELYASRENRTIARFQSRLRTSAFRRDIENRVREELDRHTLLRELSRATILSDFLLNIRLLNVLEVSEVEILDAFTIGNGQVGIQLEASVELEVEVDISGRRGGSDPDNSLFEEAMYAHSTAASISVNCMAELVVADVDEDLQVVSGSASIQDLRDRVRALLRQLDLR